MREIEENSLQKRTATWVWYLEKEEALISEVQWIDALFLVHPQMRGPCKTVIKMPSRV